MQNYLYCGAAKSKITPLVNIIENLRGLQDRLIGGIIDDLYLRAIALKNKNRLILLISFDLDKVPDPSELFDILTEQFPVREEDILLTAIHTHSAPVTGKRPFEKRNNISLKTENVQQATHTYESFLKQCLVQTVEQAIEKAEPVRVGSAIGESYINADRRQIYSYRDADGTEHIKCALGVNYASEIDRSVTVISFENMQGNKIAFFINYPVHCCVMHANKCCDGKLGLSSDIGGNVSKLIEARYPDSVALWCSGAAGDINPIIQNELYFPDPKNGQFTVSTLSGGSKDILNFLVTRHFDDIVRTVNRIEYSDDNVCLSGCVGFSVSAGKNGDYRLRLHLMRLNGFYLLGIGGELYSSYLRYIKNIFPNEKIIVINHDASLYTNAGYIIDDETFAFEEVDLPGIRDTNMVPGAFLKPFLSKVREMKEKTDAVS